MKIFGYTLKSLVPGAVAVVGVGAVGGVLVGAFVLGGGLNLRAGWADPKIVYYALHAAFKNSVWWRQADDVPDDLDDPGRIALGGQHYINACAKCHGGPGLGQNPQALAMRPRPQHLPAVVDQFNDGELHYILDGGVRMSAMPAWPTQGRDDEIWNVVAFIRQLPEMTHEDYIALVNAGEEAASFRLPYGERGPLLDNGIDDDPNQERWPEEEYGYTSPSTEWRDFAISGDVIERCSACHGADGAGAPTVGRAPNLTILPEGYVTQALTDYASGARKSGIMQIVASNLSAQQRQGLGEYYESLPDQKAPAAATIEADMTLGETIATQGKLLEAVPACVTCHNNPEVQGREVAGMNVPNLAGQSPHYIRQQLALFASGVREGGAPWKPMGYIASNLTGEEMDALAAWFGSQEPAARIAPQDMLAEADPTAGAEVVERVCKECHTERGIGSQSGDTPNLSLQNGEYLYHQLVAFREDIRQNSSQMSQTAKQLDLDELADAAAYFGTLPPLAVERDVDMGSVSRGADIALYGLPASGVPACLTCHGPEPTQDLDLLPHLHGQNYVYLNQRLDYFHGDTGESVYDFSPMPRFANAMTGEEREDVAAWFSAQEPLAK